MNLNEFQKVDEELMKEYNLTKEEFWKAMTGPRPSIVWRKDIQLSTLEKYKALVAMQISPYAEEKKNRKIEKEELKNLEKELKEKYNLTDKEYLEAMSINQHMTYNKETRPSLMEQMRIEDSMKIESYINNINLLKNKSQNNTWWYNQEPDEIKEKLMKEYQLTLEEYTEVTKPPICVLGKKDPITGIRKFPEYKKLTKEEIIKYKREDIERAYHFFKELSIRDIKKQIRERYNISTEELLFAISGATSNLKYKPPIRIRRDWSLMVEAYLRGKREKEEFLKDKKIEYATRIDINGVSINAQDLSIESFEKKAGVEHEKAVKFMNIVNKSFVVTPEGLKTKERDPVLKYIEPVIITRANKYEKIYERAVFVIKEMAMNKENELSTFILSKKLKVSFKTTETIFKMLNEMRIIEYIYGEVHPKIL